jgi:hypothetical protein
MDVDMRLIEKELGERKDIINKQAERVTLLEPCVLDAARTIRSYEKATKASARESTTSKKGRAERPKARRGGFDGHTRCSREVGELAHLSVQPLSVRIGWSG